MTTYECAICRNVNSTIKHHCSTCGTVPVMYSATRIACNEAGTEVVKAHGAELQTRYRAAKSMMRTVPLDYYAEV